MAEPRGPREVFLDLVNSIADGQVGHIPDLYADEIDVCHPFDPTGEPPLRSRAEMRARIPEGAVMPGHRARPEIRGIIETADPEVIVAEFAYQKTHAVTGEPVSQPAIFVMRVRDGKIVSSRDYHDHLQQARVRGQLGDLAARITAADEAAARPASRG
ncbi:MAG: nuclear transport factor 2 family protein [Streptosporangiales bacterium]|nr:nuclear transport factor 2 family protein [Streptosporangiales bacterium]